MLGFNLSVGRNRQSFGDADAQAFITATGLTGTTETTAVRRLVSNLKTYGLWSKMKAIYPFVSDTINLLSYSEDFTNGVWAKANSIIVTGNTTTAPDGTNTADTLTNTSGQISRVRQQINTSIGQTLTFSVWVKCASGTVSSRLNIEEGSVGFPSSQLNFTATTSWQRVSLTRTLTGSGSTSQFDIWPDTTLTGQSIYVWGAQTELSSSATTYQPIATTPANRFVSQFKYNLKDPRDLDAAFRLSFNGTWAYSKQGATGNGVNAYANTYLNMASVLTNNNNHMSFYSRTNSLGSGVLKMDLGITDNTTHSNQLSANYNGTNALFENGSTLVYVANANTIGMYIGSTISSTSGKLYKNNSILGSSTTLNTYSLFSNNIYLSATNVSSSNTPTYYSNREKAFTTIGDGLTDTEATNLYTSVQQFNQDLSRQVGVPIVSDADAQSFLDAAQITDLTQANAINTLVVGLKNASLWTKMKAIYPFVGGTATSHKWNLKDPRDLDAAYRLAFYGAWTHSSTGALPNGTNAYADTKLIPNSHLSIESNHMSFYSRTQANTYSIEMGCEAVTTKDLILYHGFLTRKTIVDGAFGTNEASSNITNTLGYQIGSRTSLSNLKLYWNNSLLSTNTATKTDGQNSISIIIGATNKTTIGGYSSKQAAFSTIGDGLNDSEASTLYTLVQNFQTTLGRQV